MAKKSKKDTRVEMLKNEAMKSVESVLKSKELEFKELAKIRQYRIEQYLYALIDLWDEITPQKQPKLTDFTAKHFTEDYHQIIGLRDQIEVLKAIPYASTKKVTLIFE
jgi:hypothetical protein